MLTVCASWDPAFDWKLVCSRVEDLAKKVGVDPQALLGRFRAAHIVRDWLSAPLRSFLGRGQDLVERVKTIVKRAGCNPSWPQQTRVNGKVNTDRELVVTLSVLYKLMDTEAA